MAKLEKEIEYMARIGVEDIYITDANFGLFKRDIKITELLTAAGKTYGFPKRVRIQCAKKSNDTVFEISKRLFRNNMLWGTTLSMQSVDMEVLDAVERPHMGLDEYEALKQRYQEEKIPTYTELILGLPLETRASFTRGIGRLLEMGMHDDIRVFELVLLPNAPLSRPEKRKQFGLKTRIKPIRLTTAGFEKEFVELVFETNTMPFDDWAYCLLFSDMIQALHNGGFTRFLSIYLHRSGTFSYKTFYDRLLNHMLESDDDCFYCFTRVKKLIRDYYEDPEMPQVNRILTQKDIMTFLRRFHPTRRGWPLWTYLWVWISEKKEAFYQAVLSFLEKQGVPADTPLKDLINYQEELMLSPDYDPEKGKTVTYRFDWHDYFFKNRDLEKKQIRLHYTDTHMGASLQYPLEKSNKMKFLTASIGFSYPYSKFRHFFHQPDRVVKK